MRLQFIGLFSLLYYQYWAIWCHWAILYQHSERNKNTWSYNYRSWIFSYSKEMNYLGGIIVITVIHLVRQNNTNEISGSEYIALFLQIQFTSQNRWTHITTGMMHTMTSLHYTSLKITCLCNYCRGLKREGEGVEIHGKLQRINIQSVLQSFSCSWQEWH